MSFKKLAIGLLLGSNFWGLSHVEGATHTTTQIIGTSVVAGDTVDTTGSQAAAFIADGVGTIIGENLTIRSTTLKTGMNGGIVAKNNGVIQLTGGTYDYVSGRSGTATTQNVAVLVQSSGSVLMDGVNASISFPSGLDPTRGSAFAIVDGAGSSFILKNSEVTSSTGAGVTVSNQGSAELANVIFTIDCDPNFSLYDNKTFGVTGEGSTLTGRNLTVTTNEVDGAYGLFYATDKGKIQLFDSSLTSTEDKSLLDVSGDGIIEGTNLALDFISTSDDVSAIHVKGKSNSDKRATLRLIDSTLNVSGSESNGNYSGILAMNADVYLENTQINVASGSGDGIQLYEPNTTLTMTQGSQITATEGASGIYIFMTGGTIEDGTAHRITIEDSEILSTEGYGIYHGNGEELDLKISGNSVIEGSLGALVANGSYTLGEISDGAQIKGDIIVRNSDGKADLTFKQNAQWIGNAVISGATGSSDDPELNLFLESGSFWEGFSESEKVNAQLSASEWKMTGDSQVGTLMMENQGKVTFDTDGSGHLIIGDLTGDQGIFSMQTDIVGQSGDFLEVIGSSAGTHQVEVINNGSADVKGTERLTIISTSDGVAVFEMPTAVELGAYEFYLQDVEGTAKKEWELYGIKKTGSSISDKPVISSTGNAGINIFTGSYLLNYVEMNTLMQRMGDLRQGNSQGNVWARTYGGELNWKNDGRLRSFDMDYWGIQVGADKKIQLKNNKGDIYVGGMFGYTDGSLDVYKGSGSIDSKSLGVYGTYIAPSGFYTDIVLKYGWMKGDFSVRDTAGAVIKGKDIETDGFIASMEVGQRIHLDKKKREGWYVEPQAQLNFGHYSGDNFRATNGLRFDVDSYNSVLGRLGANIGYEVKDGKNPINAYAKLSVVHEFDGEMDFKYNNSKESTDFGDTWVVYGVGITAKVGEKHNLYLDLERSSGGNFTQKWAINAGYRFTW